MIIPAKRLPGVLETIGAVQSARVEPRDCVEACHALAVALEPTLHAFTVLPEATPIAATAGPLAGVTVGIKDLIDTADMPTAYGSPIYRDHRPMRDAAIVTRLKTLGATPLGKTVTTEFAWRQPGPTRNPWNLAHTPGGSSSGSAASVAVGTTSFSLGTQTIGSVLRPASYCGVVGMKPSYGSIGLDGVHPLSQSLDHLGVFTRNVDDAAYILSLITEPNGPSNLFGRTVPHDGLDPGPPPRIGLIASPSRPVVETAQHRTLEESARRLQERGASIEDLSLPALFSEAADIALSICAYEAAANFGTLLDCHPELVSNHLTTLVRKGAAISHETYSAMCVSQSALRRDFAERSAEFDAVLTIAATGEALKGLADTGDGSLCSPWTLLGVPALALPVGLGPRGLPLGIQLIAPFGADAQLLRVAKWCETVLAA